MTDFPGPEGAVGSFANRCIINRSTKSQDLIILLWLTFQLAKKRPHKTLATTP